MLLQISLWINEKQKLVKSEKCLAWAEIAKNKPKSVICKKQEKKKKSGNQWYYLTNIWDRKNLKKNPLQNLNISLPKFLSL